MTLATDRKPKLVGINHVALEVGDIGEAFAFYGSIFDFTCAAARRATPSSILATSSWR